MPRLTHPLPVLNDQAPHIQGDGEGLVVFLAPVNDPWIQARIGDERVREEPYRMPGCRITEGMKFKSPAGGSQQGRRYLWTLNGQDAIGALNVTLKVEPGRRKPLVTVSNIFVHPDHRRQGVATAMVERARQDFPGLTVDAAMSTAGAAFFLGQGPTITMEMDALSASPSEAPSIAADLAAVPSTPTVRARPLIVDHQAVRSRRSGFLIGRWRARKTSALCWSDVVDRQAVIQKLRRHDRPRFSGRAPRSTSDRRPAVALRPCQAETAGPKGLR